MTIKLNDLYSNGKESLFKIIGIELKDSDPWVTYINTQTGQEYSCRQEAFLLRFYLLPS
jgi:hypothetical protein